MAQGTIGSDGSKMNGGRAGRGAEARASGPRTARKSAAGSAKPEAPAAAKSAGAEKSARPQRAKAKGVSVARRFTERSVDPLEQVTWERRSSVITNTDGSVVFKMEGAEIPAGWSQQIGRAHV